jgi:hypothetical protein
MLKDHFRDEAHSSPCATFQAQIAKLKISLLFFTCFVSLLSVHLQVSAQRKKTFPAPVAETSINPLCLIGVWEPLQEDGKAVEFLYVGNNFVLRSPAYGGFLFFSCGYEPFISVTGCIAKWPPDYCDVSQVSDSLISVTYRMSWGESVTLPYRRADGDPKSR